MIGEIKRGIRFPRKHFRRFLGKKKCNKDIRLNLQPMDEIRKMKEKLEKEWIEVEHGYENKTTYKVKDERYWKIIYWRECLNWVLRKSRGF